MKSLGQKSIPVLVVEQQRNLQLINGGNAIMNYLDKTCRLPTSTSYPDQSLNIFDPANELVLQSQDDSCSDDVDCEEMEAERE